MLCPLLQTEIPCLESVCSVPLNWDWRKRRPLLPSTGNWEKYGWEGETLFCPHRHLGSPGVPCPMSQQDSDGHTRLNNSSCFAQHRSGTPTPSHRAWRRRDTNQASWAGVLESWDVWGVQTGSARTLQEQSRRAQQKQTSPGLYIWPQLGRGFPLEQPGGLQRILLTL